MKPQVFFTAIAGLLVFSVLGLIKYSQINTAIEAGKSRVMPPSAVTTAVVEESLWDITVDSVGTLASVQGAELSAQAAGRVIKVAFTPGSQVETGQVLIAIDSDVEVAQLKAAKAELELAAINNKRQEKLREMKANSELDLDLAKSEYSRAQATVEQLTALIEKRQVRAPFPGIAGLNFVQEGQTVAVGTTLLTISELDSLHVDFNIPQSAISLIKVGNELTVQSDSFPAKPFLGHVIAIDSAVNEVTRTLAIRGVVDNKEHLLLPGMFVSVSTTQPEKKKVLAVPSSAISYAPYGNTVFLAVKDETGALVSATSAVTLGLKKGDLVEVISGLKAGDKIVTSGTFKLRPGEALQENNSVAPTNELNPEPANT
ncbi:MAG: efflux RND transporter periplasmic adaptor subunit [bacterium]|nr:efflux RND transporter periplasmic adaptor subunit [bacterium]